MLLLGEYPQLLDAEGLSGIASALPLAGLPIVEMIPGLEDTRKSYGLFPVGYRGVIANEYGHRGLSLLDPHRDFSITSRVTVRTLTSLAI